jgi:gamma-glutamyl hercynylcysteine S-oxide synthase
MSVTEHSAEQLLAGLAEARERTLAVVERVSEPDLERVHSTLMSPLVWDLGHIAAFEDLWIVHRYGGRELLRPDLMEVYDAFETPRAERGDLPYLRPAEAFAYLEAVRERALDVVESRGTGDGLLHELVLRHEQQHTETMFQTLQLAQLEGYELPTRLSVPRRSGTAAVGDGGLELVEIPGGPFAMGAGPAGFAYDNERPRHQRRVPTFRIGRTPITNATFLQFVEGGGYERREWWSDEGWSWKEEYDISRPGGWTADGREWRVGRLEPLAPDQPVVHVSWFEADAFARAHGVRLPTEAEWEKAATWDQQTGTPRTFPWGEEPWSAARSNLDQTALGPLPVSAFPGGASPCGALGMLGDVWEWTASPFTGYPGFRAHPYPEYSQVFFGTDYKVLRGGSWATRPRVATPTFRNWDFPIRRQIFAGFRIASDERTRS